MVRRLVGDVVREGVGVGLRTEGGAFWRDKTGVNLGGLARVTSLGTSLGFTLGWGWPAGP
jgi:hypothetical protein